MILQSRKKFLGVREGFTLVELLVVIAIIGVLVALLIPAVNGAREVARKAQCTNNLKNLGQVIVMHHTAKQAYPGRVNFAMSNLGEPIPISWMTKLLPYMEKNNVWDSVLNQSIALEEWNSIVIPAIADPLSATVGPDGNRPWYTLELELATCPSDPATSQLGARLSYVINAGIWDRMFGDTGPVSPSILAANHPWKNDSRANGIGNILPYNQASNGKVDSGYVSKGDGTTSTVLLSENVNAISWPMLEEAATGIVWTDQEVSLPQTAPLTAGQQYGINIATELYLDEQLLTMSQQGPDQLISIARPSSNHSGGVNMLFCDGRVEFVSSDMHPWLYARRLSVNKSQTIYPSYDKGRIPAQMSPQDSNGFAVATDL